MFDTPDLSTQRLNRAEYRDKVLGCWTGKNIGGTLGAPFEGRTEMNDATFYVQDLKGNPAPNDDLDLQLVWLLAAEETGVYRLNERVLGEFWLSNITGPWNEYGVGKANMRMGLTPPLSGACNNERWHASNGAWIRSEIWACIFPGSPDEAAQYAYYDACCDHYGDGIHAEVFTATLESAAFVEADLRKLLAIGLARIPKDSRVARAVKVACDCYDKKIPFADARAAVVKDSEDLGWFQAPGNLGFVTLGLLYGEGDFGRTVTLANQCGDDTDCTAGTAASIMGIVLGRSGLPAKWIEPIGESIQTCSIDTYGRNGLRFVPRTLAELTDRVVALAEEAERENGTLPRFTDDPTAFDAAYRKKLSDPAGIVTRVWKRSPYELTFDLPFGQVSADYDGGPYAAPGEPCRVTFRVKRVRFIEKIVSFTPHWPEGWQAKDTGEVLVNAAFDHARGAALEVVPADFPGAFVYVPVTVKVVDRAVPYTINLPFQKKGAALFYSREPDWDFNDAILRVRSLSR